MLKLTGGRNLELEKKAKDVQDLVYLVACAVHEKAPDTELIKEMDFDEIHKLAAKQTIAATVAHALKPVREEIGEEKYEPWLRSEVAAVRRNMLVGMERASILDWMEKNCIWYMPLKGVILKDMYPSMGMREMMDNDILFDPSARAAVRDHMVEAGYEVKLYETDKDDQYIKQPMYSFEMHVALAEDFLYPKLYAYYKDVKERLVRDENREYGYHFTDEDFYIFHIAHAKKHTDNAGYGIRSLIDSYVFLSQKPDMNWEYIENQLEILDMLEFETKMRGLAFRLFGSTEYGIFDRCTEDELAQLKEYVKAGTFGTFSKKIENYINNLMETNCAKNAKSTYYLHRLFPTKATMKRNYHVLLRHGWLLPFCYIHRLIRGVVFKQDKIKREMTEINKV
jgi:hypothetical protein